MKRDWHLQQKILCGMIGLAMALPAMGQGALAGSAAQGAPQDREARMNWWRDARFGMFIHWGVYCVPAGVYHGRRDPKVGEWIKAQYNIPNREYDQIVAQFNPTKYDPAAWVRAAKAAGVKYIVITSKHHDGFCMWGTKATKYNVVDATPYGKDVLGPLAAECKKQGITFCLYYSIMDWHHPSQKVVEKGQHPDSGSAQTVMLPGRKPEYINYMKAQLKELVTKYDPAVLWFDGGWCDWWTQADGQDLYDYCRRLKPSLIVNNRVDNGRGGKAGPAGKGKNYIGDFGTPEQHIPIGGLPGTDWESCMTMNDNWGYNQLDHHFKSSQQLIRNLIDIASKGGNYLLNVGPTSEGLLPPESLDRLADIGRWMRVNGQSIYGTTATPLGKLAWGRSTQKPGRLYLHVFDWPEGRLELPVLANKITGAYLLSDPTRKPLQVTQSDSALFVLLPKNPPDPIATVIVLEIEGNVKLAGTK